MSSFRLKTGKNAALGLEGGVFVDVKSLGRSIGSLPSSAKPSDFDGDGDGFLTGPDGRDNIPAPEAPMEKARHAGSQFLDLFNSHEKEMTEKFGDLRDADNVRRAIKQTFPNVRNFDWLSDSQKTLNDMEYSRVSALLDLGQDKKVAETLLEIGWTSEEDFQNASVMVGFTDMNDGSGPRFTHALQWNKNMVRPPASLRDRLMVSISGGWGDKIAHKMIKEKVAEEEIMRFWTHYLIHHEWTHVEHRKASFEKMGLPFSENPKDFLKAIAVLDGVDDKQFDEIVKNTTDARKKINPKESAKDLDIFITRSLLRMYESKIISRMDEGMNDDLSPEELRQLSGKYADSISAYAGANFKELVAEKASAERLNYSLGEKNASWIKFNSWLYKDKKKSVIDITNKTPKQRKMLGVEFLAQKGAKQDLSDIQVSGSQKPFNLRIHTCDGFKHYGKIMGEKSSPYISSIKGMKVLGRAIGAKPGKPSDFDGDGDGFVTGPDGRDNIPAPTQVVDNLKGAWNKLREKKMAGDEARAIKAANLVKGKKPKYTPQEINKLLRGARTREDVVEARKIVREWSESIFALDGLGDDGSNKVVIFKGKTGVNIVGRKREVPSVNDQDPDEPYLHIRVSGKIVDKNGKEVGLFERRFYLDDYNAAKKPHVYNEILRMQPDAKGKGIGADFTLASEAQYAAMSLDEMRLNAGLADGVYTWLRAGYRFKNDKERVDFAETIEKRYQEMLKDAGSKENLVKGGFMTSVGGRKFDDEKTVKMPEPLFESLEQLELFLKFLGRAKGSPQGSEREIPPAAFTMFGEFSKRLMRGMNNDMVKDINPRFATEGKALVITGIDILTTRVYD